MYHLLTTTAAICLLLPATLTAQNVSIDLVAQDPAGSDFDGPFVSELDGSDFGPGSEFIMWSVVHTDTMIKDLNYRLHVNGDADNHKFDLVDYAISHLSWLEPMLSFPPGRLSGYGTAFSINSSLYDFGYLDYTKKTPARLDLLADSELIQHPSNGTNYADGKTLIGYVIQANINFTPGVYEFSVLGSTGSTPTAVWSSSTQTGEITEGASLILTPEPSAALLLVATLPFLRRGRGRGRGR